MTDRFNKIATIAKHWAPRVNAEVLDLVISISVVDDVHDLRLDDMLADLDSFHVAHDIAGILKNLDHESKLLQNCWTPRFGRDWQEIQDAQSWENDLSLPQNTPSH